MIYRLQPLLSNHGFLWEMLGLSKISRGKKNTRYQPYDYSLVTTFSETPSIFLPSSSTSFSTMLPAAL